MRVLTVGGCALETRVRCSQVTARTGYREQEAATIYDRPGGSGWFLSLGAAIANTQVDLLCNLGGDPAAAQIRRIATQCQVSLRERKVAATPRFILLVNAAGEHFRFASRANELVIPEDLLEYDGVFVGFVGNSTLNALSISLAGSRRKPFILYAPSNSVEFIKLDLFRQFLTNVHLLSLTAREATIMRQRVGQESIEVPHLIETDKSSPIRCRIRSPETVFSVWPEQVHFRRADFVGSGDLLASITASLVACGASVRVALNTAVRVLAQVARSDDPERKCVEGRELISEAANS